MSGDRNGERSRLGGRVPEVIYGWSERFGGGEYKIAMVSMAGETKKRDGSWGISLNNDRAFARMVGGKILAMVADGADGNGKWGGVLADKLISAMFEKGLSVESLRDAALVVSKILKKENVTMDVGSTFTGVEIDVGGEMKLLHLGDSRAYVLGSDRLVLTKLTQDRDALHDAARAIQGREGVSWEAALYKAERLGASGNVLTSAVLSSMNEEDVSVKMAQVRLDDLKPGEVLIICSDGLEKYLPVGEIWRITKDCVESGAGAELAERLVREAYRQATAKKQTIRRIDAITVVTMSL